MGTVKTEWDVLDHMRAHGVPCSGPIVADGKIHRFKVDGSKKKNGWAWFVERGGRWFGVYGDWATGTTVKLGEETTEFREMRKERRAVAVDESVRAREKARKEWEALSYEGTSKYLKRKGVPPKGVRFGPDFIAVPMYNVASGDMVGLQKIYDDGRKRFTFGCAKKGAHMTVAGAGPIVVICEGYATAMSVHVATGYTVVVAFDAGNIMPVALGLHTHRLMQDGSVLFFIAGDNDYATEGNPGKTAAEAAAKAIGCRWTVPYGIEGTDFNDCMLEQGAFEVRCQIIDAL